jgi:anti-anti-sigma factor
LPEEVPLIVTPVLTIESSTDGNASVLIRMRGELDIASATVFAAILGEIVRDRAVARAILWSEELEFIDCAGARAIAAVASSLCATQRRLVVLKPTACARRVLTLMGLGELIAGDCSDLSMPRAQVTGEDHLSTSTTAVQ